MSNIYEITHLLIQQRGEVKAAQIFINNDKIGLKVGYSPGQLIEFIAVLRRIDALFLGTIWFQSGSYAYLDKDGAGYYWNYVSVPEIPNELC